MSARIQVGDTVRTGVYVLGEWEPMAEGIVKWVSADGSIADVDVMSLHGGAPWIRTEATSSLRKEPEASQSATCRHHTLK